MATTTTTARELPPGHRLRLMRSARKLGNLLGGTPLIVSPSDTNKQHQRGDVLLAEEIRMPPVDPALNLVGEDQAARPTLMIHLPSITCTPAPETLTPVSVSVSTPLTPTFSFMLNSPVIPPVTVDAARRRKTMAKLVRTLGENIPPELVFGPDSESDSRPALMERGRRASTRSLPALPAESESSSLSTTTTAVSRNQNTLASNASVEHLVASSPSTSHTRNESGDPGMRRAEQGWSGEWGGGPGQGVESIADVVRGLRRLKAK
ncbi:hypothetical protein FB45DRAFT_1010144 [Roridomyces roridus]|uniref:Uncharacterized protein n=1 Tax=Roridomyces roridus TaxID=1738132 RepID=A0AAD7B501_9AGAR|nr:hypothetical protein FB45DRAFT_1010144 [Roridomyces roridus]